MFHRHVPSPPASSASARRVARSSALRSSTRCSVTSSETPTSATRLPSESSTGWFTEWTRIRVPSRRSMVESPRHEFPDARIEKIPAASSQLRRARHWVRDQLDPDIRIDRAHVEAVQTVANELLGAALQAGISQPAVLSVELFPRLTSVRVHCASDVDLRDEPFGMREN